MLSKEGFCKALQMIKEQESIDEQFSKALNLVGDGHFVFGAENKYLMALRDVLKEAVNDQYDYIDVKMKRLPPLSEMERIEQTLLVEKLDEILERIDNEDIGFVITENGLPDMVLIPFRWFAENFPDEVPDDLRSADYKSG